MFGDQAYEAQRNLIGLMARNITKWNGNFFLHDTFQITIYSLLCGFLLCTSLFGFITFLLALFKFISCVFCLWSCVT